MHPGNTLLTRQVLPKSQVLSNMTGHAMWQTFLNHSSQDTAAPGEDHSKNPQQRKQQVSPLMVQRYSNAPSSSKLW